MKIFANYSQYYDLLYRTKGYSEEVKFVTSVIKKYKPNSEKILSLGCGTCSHDILLAKKGFDITGVDISTTMLNIAKQKIEKENLKNKIRLIKQDIREMKIKEKHDVAMAMFNVIGYQTSNSDIEKALGNVNRSLKKGGIFFFDCWYLPAVLKDKPTDRIKEIESKGKRIIRRTHSQLLLEKDIIEIKFNIEYIEKNKIVEKTEEIHLMRYFSLPELEYILNSNGFKVIKIGNFLDLDTPPSDNNWDMFVVARKV